MIDLSAPWHQAAVRGRRIGHVVEAHARIGSTNDRARELLAADGSDGVVVVAEEQTAGRGRRGRGWHSPAGGSLAVSAALRPTLDAGDAWQLALASALAAARACDPVAAVGLKWPNDVVDARGRKLGGILIETVIEGDALSAAIIGIGLNVAWARDEMPAEIREGATSLAELADGPIDRVALLSRLLDALSDEVVAIERGDSPLERYRVRCVTLGSDVEVAAGESTVSGRAVDLDETGALVVETLAGRRAVASGEVLRVRPGAP